MNCDGTLRKWDVCIESPTELNIDFRWEYVSKEYNWDHYDMAKKQANDDCRGDHVSYDDQMKMFFT